MKTLSEVKQAYAKAKKSETRTRIFNHVIMKKLLEITAESFNALLENTELKEIYSSTKEDWLFSGKGKHHLMLKKEWWHGRYGVRYNPRYFMIIHENTVFSPPFDLTEIYTA